MTDHTYDRDVNNITQSAASRPEGAPQPHPLEEGLYMQAIGGVCFAHGRYDGSSCPKWPACITDPQKPEYVAQVSAEQLWHKYRTVTTYEGFPAMLHHAFLAAINEYVSQQQAKVEELERDLKNAQDRIRIGGDVYEAERNRLILSQAMELEYLQRAEAAESREAELRQELEGAQAREVWGFYEYDFPMYTNRDKAMELCSPITVEEANSLVKIIKELLRLLVMARHSLKRALDGRTLHKFENEQVMFVLAAIDANPQVAAELKKGGVE